MPELTGDLDTILEWADEYRRLGVRANADNPADAQLSRDFGAEGIGLDRTEHMFLGERKQIIQTFILNEDEEVRKEAVEQLFEAQTGDFYGMFKAMDGLPVIVRLLDPPLHEVPREPAPLDVEIARMEATGADAKEIASQRELMDKIDSMAEAEPDAGACAAAVWVLLHPFFRDAGARYRDRSCQAQEGRSRSQARDYDSAGFPR